MAKKIVITVNFASETLTKRQLSRHLQALVRNCLADCDEGGATRLYESHCR